MTEKNLFSAISNIDEKYIEEAADEERIRTRFFILRRVAAAAVFILVVTASLFVLNNASAKSEPYTEGSLIGTMDESENSSGDSQDSVATDSELQIEDESSRAENNLTGGASSAYSGGTKGEGYNYLQINLDNGRYYRYISNSELSKLGIKPISKDDLGKKIGVIKDEDCNNDIYIGCEMFSHKQMACDAIIIVKKDSELIPFVFLGFKTQTHDFSEILDIHGADDSTDIEKITTRGLHDNINDEKVIDDTAQIKAVYDILKVIQNDNGKNDNIKKQYHQSGEKTYLYFKLHFKNGLTYQSFYRVYSDTSYIENHDFLTDEQSETLKNILIK